MNNKISTTVLFVVVIVVFIFQIITDIRANKMLKEFFSLPIDSFSAIAMVRFNSDHEYILEKGATDYIIIGSLFIDLLESLKEEAPSFQKGELRGVGDITMYLNAEKYYKLDISYIGSLDAIYMWMSNEKNLIITKNYFVDRGKVDNFFNEFEKIKIQLDQVATD